MRFSLSWTYLLRFQGTSDVDETIRRITSHKGEPLSHVQYVILSLNSSWHVCAHLNAALDCAGVLGVLIVNADGIPIRTTMENNISVQVRCFAEVLGRCRASRLAPEMKVDSARKRPTSLRPSSVHPSAGCHRLALECGLRSSTRDRKANLFESLSRRLPSAVRVSPWLLHC